MTSFLTVGHFVVPAATQHQLRGEARFYGLKPVVLQRLPTDPTGSATLTFVGLPTGTDIVVLTAGTTTVLLQVDAHPATSYAYTYNVFAADTVVDVGFIRQGYEVQYVRNLTLPRRNAVLPIALRPDRNFT